MKYRKGSLLTPYKIVWLKIRKTYFGGVNFLLRPKKRRSLPPLPLVFVRFQRKRRRMSCNCRRCCKRERAPPTVKSRAQREGRNTFGFLFCFKNLSWTTYAKRKQILNFLLGFHSFLVFALNFKNISPVPSISL